MSMQSDIYDMRYAVYAQYIYSKQRTAAHASRHHKQWWISLIKIMQQ